MGLRIFLACAFGATIGTLVALNSNPNFWWVGLLAGAVTGYVTFDIRAILVAIPEAWEKARPEMESPALIRRAMEIWSACLVTAVSSGFLVMLLFWNFLFWMFRLMDESVATWTVAPSTLALVLSIFLSALHAALLLSQAFERAAEDLTIRNKCHIAWRKKEERQLMLAYNPVTLFILWPAAVLWRTVLFLIPLAPKVSIDLVKGCVQAARAVITCIPVFTRHLFILIHSELRLLCACDAAIGAAIGFAAGSVITGALAGGIFGLLNYEVVSKRLLGLASAKA
jgi:hypothetical protein